MLPEHAEFLVWVGSYILYEGVFLCDLKERKCMNDARKWLSITTGWGISSPVSRDWRILPKEEVPKAIIGGPEYCREAYRDLED